MLRDCHVHLGGDTVAREGLLSALDAAGVGRRVERDRKILDSLGVGEEAQGKLFSGNLERFLAGR